MPTIAPTREVSVADADGIRRLRRTNALERTSDPAPTGRVMFTTLIGGERLPPQTRNGGERIDP